MRDILDIAMLVIALATGVVMMSSHPPICMCGACRIAREGGSAPLPTDFNPPRVPGKCH